MFRWAFCSLICYAGAFYFVVLGGGYKGDAVVLGGAEIPMWVYTHFLYTVLNVYIDKSVALYMTCTHLDRQTERQADRHT